MVLISTEDRSDGLQWTYTHYASVVLSSGSTATAELVIGGAVDYEPGTHAIGTAIGRLGQVGGEHLGGGGENRQPMAVNLMSCAPALEARSIATISTERLRRCSLLEKPGCELGGGTQVRTYVISSQLV